MDNIKAFYTVEEECKHMSNVFYPHTESEWVIIEENFVENIITSIDNFIAKNKKNCNKVVDFSTNVSLFYDSDHGNIDFTDGKVVLKISISHDYCESRDKKNSKILHIYIDKQKNKKEKKHTVMLLLSELCSKFAEKKEKISSSEDSVEKIAYEKMIENMTDQIKILEEDHESN